MGINVLIYSAASQLTDSVLLMLIPFSHKGTRHITEGNFEMHENGMEVMVTVNIRLSKFILARVVDLYRKQRECARNVS